MRRIALWLALISTSFAQAPTPIHTVYDSSMGSTDIKTNWLYVVNDPDQFLQLKLVGSFRGKKMPATGPTALQVEVISQAPKHKYVDLPELMAIVDGAELKIGRMEAHPNQMLLGMFRGGQKGAEDMVNKTISPVPANAAVLANHKAEDLVGEWLVTNIAWDQLVQMSKATSIEWTLGTTKFSFNEIQRTRLQQFVTAVTPASGTVVVDSGPSKSERIEKVSRTDTPSAANNTTLTETMKWLRTQITKYATAVSLLGGAEKLTIPSVNNCEMKIRIEPTGVGTVSRTIEYVLNLKDIEPGSVEMIRRDKDMVLGLSTRDRKQVIRLITTDQSRTAYEDRFVNRLDLYLRKNDLGGEIREALRHAVTMCADK